MKLKDKLNGKLFKVAVHVAKKPDCNNYKYSAKEIKQLLTSEAGKTRYTYLHDGPILDNVVTIANYTNDNYDEIFNEGTDQEEIIPAGSHIKIIHSKNKKLNKAIEEGFINAVSSEQQPNFDQGCSKNTMKLIKGFTKNGETTPHDIDDMECIIYNTLAFVENGCNGVGIEELDYNFYIENYLSQEKKEDITMELTDKDLGVLSSIMKVMNFHKDESKSITSEEVQNIVNTEIVDIKTNIEDDLKDTIKQSVKEELSVYNEKIEDIVKKFEEPKDWLENVTDKAFWDKIQAEDQAEIADKTKQVASDTLDILNEKEQEELIKQLEKEGYSVEIPKPEIEDAKSKLEEMGYNITINNEKKDLKLQLENPKDIVITNTAREVIRKPSTFAELK